jgi:hypothetical protein
MHFCEIYLYTKKTSNYYNSAQDGSRQKVIAITTVNIMMIQGKAISAVYSKIKQGKGRF